MKKTANKGRREIAHFVYCAKCDKQYDAKAVKFLDVSEDIQGRDVMEFQCPKKHLCSSYVRLAAAWVNE